MSAKYAVRRLDGGTPIPEDEPCFVFRAKDKHARAALDAYVAACIRDPDCTDAHVAAICMHISKIVEWQAKHGTKVPD